VENQIQNRAFILRKAVRTLLIVIIISVPIWHLQVMQESIQPIIDMHASLLECQVKCSQQN